jgi:hypothetical protein
MTDMDAYLPFYPDVSITEYDEDTSNGIIWVFRQYNKRFSLAQYDWIRMYHGCKILLDIVEPHGLFGCTHTLVTVPDITCIE